jgi:hypothetical protein
VLRRAEDNDSVSSAVAAANAAATAAAVSAENERQVFPRWGFDKASAYSIMDLNLGTFDFSFYYVLNFFVY